MKKIILIIIALALLVLGIASFNAPKTNEVVNAPSVGATSGPDNYVPYNFYNGLYGKLFTQGGGVLSFTATSTQSARTLTQAELAQNRLMYVNIANSPALTVTLPASSTLTSLIKNPGDEMTFMIYNAQTGAATTTTVVGGTGTTLGITTANCAIAATKSGSIRLVRLPNTNVWATCATSNN